MISEQSLSDFVMFGQSQLFNDYFEIILGTTRIPIVIIVGVIASIYTAYGGLYVSIITDQVQVWSSHLFFSDVL